MFDRVRSDFVGHHSESGQVRDTERCRNGHIRSVSSGRHQHPPYAWLDVASIKRPPTILQIDFEPGAEIHGGGLFRNSDIAEISGGVASGNVEGAAESDGQVLKIAADTSALGEDIQRRLRRTGVLVAECYLPIYPATDCVYAVPSRLQMAEQFNCDVG